MTKKFSDFIKLATGYDSIASVEEATKALDEIANGYYFDDLDEFTSFVEQNWNSECKIISEEVCEYGIVDVDIEVSGTQLSFWFENMLPEDWRIS